MVSSAKPNHRVRAKVICRLGHEHEVCILIQREVHPDLRCAPDASQGFATGGGGCVLPDNLADLAEQELRDRFQESRRRGWLLIAA